MIVYIVFALIVLLMIFQPFANFDWFFYGEWPSGIMLILLVIIGCWSCVKINEYRENRKKNKHG